jgi:copper chaperone CopZ
MKILAAILILSALPAPEIQQLKYRVTGLYNPEREADLREAVQAMKDVTIEAIDFDSSEVTFSCDPVKVLGKGTEKQWIERLDNQLRQASHHTFGIKALCATPKEKLTRIEIAVAGLDCKGCELSAYEVIFKVDGVEQATCSFKAGKMTALIDPEKTNKAALEDTLKKRNVTVIGTK